MATTAKTAPRLSPDAIAAIERILVKEGRRAEVTRTKGGGVKVTELTHKAAYKTPQTV